MKLLPCESCDYWVRLREGGKEGECHLHPSLLAEVGVSRWRQTYGKTPGCPEHSKLRSTAYIPLKLPELEDD